MVHPTPQVSPRLDDTVIKHIHLGESPAVEPYNHFLAIALAITKDDISHQLVGSNIDRNMP